MTREVAGKLKYEKTSCFYSIFFPSLKGLKNKMSSTDPMSNVLLTDTPNEVKKKINKSFSGGGETVEDHKKNGANLEIDVPY